MAQERGEIGEQEIRRQLGEECAKEICIFNGSSLSQVYFMVKGIFDQQFRS